MTRPTTAILIVLLSVSMAAAAGRPRGISMPKVPVLRLSLSSVQEDDGKLALEFEMSNRHKSADAKGGLRIRLWDDQGREIGHDPIEGAPPPRTVVGTRKYAEVRGNRVSVKKRHFWGQTGCMVPIQAAAGNDGSASVKVTHVDEKELLIVVSWQVAEGNVSNQYTATGYWHVARTRTGRWITKRSGTPRMKVVPNGVFYDVVQRWTKERKTSLRSR